jgi:predicted ArsR family transcriptional regulator
MSTGAIAKLLAITPPGARQLLKTLREEQLVEYSDLVTGVGRPTHVWRLTDKGHARFPDRHADLTLALIQATRNVFGEAGLEKLIAMHAGTQRKHYRQVTSGKDGLIAKLRALASARSAEGYMAEVRMQPDGSYILAENHCPICAAANSCQGLCRSELTVFRQIFGNSAQVERVEHVLTGARRCAYRISPK